MTFQAPKTIPELGAEPNRVLTQAFTALQNLLAERGLVITPVKNASYSADLLEFVRTVPPAASMRVLVPASSVSNAGKFILVSIESVASGGTVTLAVVGGTQKVNNAATVTLSVTGLAIAYSTGTGWVCTLLAASGGGLTPIADDSVLANVSGAPAVPIGVGLATLAVGGATGITWNAAANRFEVISAPTVTTTDVTITLAFSMKQFDTVVVVDAAIGVGSKITVGWGTPLPADENNPEDDATFFTAAAAAGSMTVRVYKPAPSSFIGGAYKIRYIIGV